MPAHTDCANVSGGSWYNGLFQQNDAWLPHNPDRYVCEHTYIQGTGDTVSNQCAVGGATSCEDLVIYWQYGIDLSGHSVNDSNITADTWGDVSVGAPNCQVI